MVGDSADRPSSYLRTVLNDGIQPFRYRSRIRLLLGLPADDGVQVSFARPLPDVGFVYVQPRFTGNYDASGESPDGSTHQYADRIAEVVDLAAIAASSYPERREGSNAVAATRPGQMAAQGQDSENNPKPRINHRVEPVPGAALSDAGRTAAASRPTPTHLESALVTTDLPAAISRSGQTASAAMPAVQPEEAIFVIPGVTVQGSDRMPANSGQKSGSNPLPIAAEGALPSQATGNRAAAPAHPAEAHSPSAVRAVTPIAVLPVAAPFEVTQSMAYRAAEERAARTGIGEQLRGVSDHESQLSIPRMSLSSPPADAGRIVTQQGSAVGASPVSFPGQAASNLAEAEATGSAITGTTRAERRLLAGASLNIVVQTATPDHPTVASPAHVEADQSASAPTAAVSRTAKVVGNRGDVALVAPVVSAPASVSISLPLQAAATGEARQTPTRVPYATASASPVVREVASPPIRATPVAGQRMLFELEGEEGQGAHEGVGSIATRPTKQANQSLSMSSTVRSSGQTQTPSVAEPEQSTTAPPAPAVMVVRPATRKTAPSPAFWERRHLSRLRARILR